MSGRGEVPQGGRLHPLLRWFASKADDAVITVERLQESSGWEKATAQRTVYNAVSFGYIEPTRGAERGKTRSFRLTPLGRQKLCELPPAPADDAGDALNLRALELLKKHAAGLNSRELAEQLGVTKEAVEAALAPHVEAHHLVTAGQWKDGEQATLYRIGMAGVQAEDWRRLGLGGGAAAFKSLTPLPTSVPVAPKPAPAAPKTQATKAAPTTAAEVASEVVDPVPPAPAPQPGIPYAGELDIDAADRAAAAREGRELDNFVCWLTSNGHLYIQQEGRRTHLTLSDTRKLLHYLDGLSASQLVERAWENAA